MNKITSSTLGKSIFLTLLLSMSFGILLAQKNINFLVATSPDSSIFKPYKPEKLNKIKDYWLKFDLQNPTQYDQTYILYTNSKWGEASLWRNNISLNDTREVIGFAGSLLPLSKRSYPRSVTAFKVILEKHQTQHFLLKLKGQLSIYTPTGIELKVSTLEVFEEHDKMRYWLQAIFLGIIIIMALYNFVIFLSVQDISYLYYVISIAGVGIYFFFYYGFGIELLWQNSPQWDTYSFAFIVPITNLARIYFTKSYLHLEEQSPLLNKGLNIFSILYLFTMLLGAICYLGNFDLLDLVIDLIGFLGTSVLTMMLLCGILVARKGYSPAIYFSLANLILVLGGNLFIIRELNWLPDNSLNRYAVQFGVLAQVVLFSLGLSSRLNQAQVKVTQLELEKERERKQLLEEQSQILKQKVAEQTADLRELNVFKTKLLSIISHDLRNPLVSLDSFLNLLINHHDRLSEPERITLTQKARQSLGNLNQLLSNLLLWSRSQMNQVSFSPQDTDIQTLVESCIKLHSLDIELKNIQIETSFQLRKPIFADAEMLDFIVRNLLGNAIKFSHKGGGVKILVEENANSHRICVIDEGVGVSDEQIEKLNSLGNITSTRGTAKEKGSGLGLILCKEFIEIHGGKLEISNKGETQFCCIFPINKT